MTRGKLVIATEDGVYSSHEFNGDMYMDNGHGPQAIKMLKTVRNYNNFSKVVSDFNKENHNYDDMDIYVVTKPYARRLSDDTQLIDVANDYFNTEIGGWFSDYLYVWNASNKAIKILAQAPSEEAKSMSDTKVYTIEPQAGAVINFGTVAEEFGGAGVTTFHIPVQRISDMTIEVEGKTKEEAEGKAIHMLENDEVTFTKRNKTLSEEYNVPQV